MQEEVNRLKRAILSRAEDMRDAMLHEIDEEKEKALTAFRKSTEEAEEARFSAEANRYRGEVNERLATLKMEEHRTLLIRREELSNTLMQEVQKELRAYVQTPAYTDYLTEKIAALAKKYEGETLFIEVCRKEDAAIAKPYAEVRLAEEDFIGGFRLGIPARHMVVDESLRSRLEDAFREFHEIRIETEEAEA